MKNFRLTLAAVLLVMVCALPSYATLSLYNGEISVASGGLTSLTGSDWNQSVSGIAISWNITQLTSGDHSGWYQYTYKFKNSSGKNLSLSNYCSLK